MSMENKEEGAQVKASPQEAHVITNNNSFQLTKCRDETQIVADAVRSSHSDAVRDLLSIGVCARCIFRLFGVDQRVYSCSFLSPAIFGSLIEAPRGSHECMVKEGFKENEGLEKRELVQEAEIEPSYCCICLGILQFSYREEKTALVKRGCVSEFTTTIAELVKQEGHELDSFSLEISTPAVIVANERSTRLYMKKKYGSELWFQEKFLTKLLSVKDALTLSITNSLETLLGVKVGIGSFVIRLSYTHTKVRLELPNLLGRDQGCKKKKTGNGDIFDAVNGSKSQSMKNSEQYNGEVDAVVYKSLHDLEDRAFCDRFKSPPEKVNQPCCLVFHCQRTPIYIGGRYLKYSRNVSQSRWIIDDERMGEASVEEIIGSIVLPICRGDNYKFHAAGREDIDVRMLGSGRPFLMEVQNSRHVPTEVSIEEIEEKINSSEVKLVRVRNLKVVGIQGWALMREGEAEKQKQYAALVWISRPLEDDDGKCISSFTDMHIMQRTPVRVLHRRSPLEREKIIHWMKVERVVGRSQYFMLHLCTQAGTYIKEFVHGDLGRTKPSIGSILGCRAEILQLDVTDVKMDCFN